MRWIPFIMRKGKREPVMMKWVMLAVVIVGMIVPMFISKPLAAWMESTARKLVSRIKQGSS